MISRTAAASTMLRITNFLMALSFGTQRAQFVQRTGLTCPRLCLHRPPLRRFLVCNYKKKGRNYSLVASVESSSIMLRLCLNKKPRVYTKHITAYMDKNYCSKLRKKSYFSLVFVSRNIFIKHFNRLNLPI